MFRLTLRRMVYLRKFVFGRNLQIINISKSCNPYTGNERIRTAKKPVWEQRVNEDRRSILRRVLAEVAAWEVPTNLLVCKVSKAFLKKRVGAKAAKKAERFASIGEYLNEEESTTYRALAARANYLAMDRPDCAYATKELCRYFAAPTKTSVEALKRLVRYLVGKPTLVWLYKMQPIDTKLMVYVDTSFGGCHTTRRSTSGGAMMIGDHLVKHWSSTQTTVALSSAEAELTGICRGAANGLGLQALAKDLGMNLTLHVASDAAAAVGICRRKGLGKVRHLATADLWVQDRVKKKDFILARIPGVDNPADVLTKHVDQMLLTKHISFMGLRFEEGRAKSAPNI